MERGLTDSRAQRRKYGRSTRGTFAKGRPANGVRLFSFRFAKEPPLRCDSARYMPLDPWLLYDDEGLKKDGGVNIVRRDRRKLDVCPSRGRILVRTVL